MKFYCFDDFTAPFKPTGATRRSKTEVSDRASKNILINVKNVDK